GSREPDSSMPRFGGTPPGNFGGIPNRGDYFKDRREKAAENHSKNNLDKATQEKHDDRDKPGANKNREEGEKFKETRAQNLRDLKGKREQNLHHVIENRNQNALDRSTKREQNARELAQKRYAALMRNYRGVLLPQFGDGSYLASTVPGDVNEQADDER